MLIGALRQIAGVQSFVLETILIFFLMFVILCVTTGAKEKGVMVGADLAVLGCRCIHEPGCCCAPQSSQEEIG